MYLKFIFIFILSTYFTTFAKTPSVPNILKHNTVKKGDSLYKVFKKNHFPRKITNKILNKYPHLKKITLSPGQIYSIQKTKDQNSISIYTEMGKKLFFWHNHKKNSFGAKRLHDKLTTKLQTVQGKVYGSLFGSINKQISNSLVPYKFQDAFLLHYNLHRDIRPGAKFKFIIEKKYHKNKFIKYGQITSAELELKGKNIKRTLIKHVNGFSYAGSVQENRRPFYSPVDYLHFASLFKRRRFHPVKKRYMAHQGIDFALPEGFPIYSVLSGTVHTEGYNRRAGKYISIKHSNGYISYYNHLSRHFNGLKKGKYIKAGQTIGWIGCTGSCTKAHLHFAVKKGNRFVNPIKLIKSYPYKAKKKITTFIANNR